MHFISHLIFFLIFLNFDDMSYPCLSHEINIIFFLVFMSIIAILKLPINIYIIINSLVLFIIFKFGCYIIDKIKSMINKSKKIS